MTQPSRNFPVPCTGKHCSVHVPIKHPSWCTCQPCIRVWQ
jgi:hypothetical protein